MVLENYVILETGVPARMHFTNHLIRVKDITDRITGEPTKRKVLVFDVDRLNGREVIAMYSIVSEKHALSFKPYLEDKSYRDYDFTITKTGEGDLTRYSVQTIPRA